MSLQLDSSSQRHIDFLHEIGEQISSAGPAYDVLKQIVDFISALLAADSCFVYILEAQDLVLRASKNPHLGIVNRLKLRLGQGITGWVAEHKKPVAVASRASMDPRFQSFHELPEDTYEAFLAVPVLCRDRLVGVINVQHREPHTYTPRDIRVIATIGFLLGPAIEMAHADAENIKWVDLVAASQIVDSAKSILQRDLSLSSAEADRLFSEHSRQRRKSLIEIAEAILLTDEMKSSPRDPQPL